MSRPIARSLLVCYTFTIALDQLADSLLHELTAAFPQRSVHGLWLYGSQANGEARPDSDVDLAVLCDVPLYPVALFDMSGRLAAQLGMAVDVVDLRQAGGLLRVEAATQAFKERHHAR